MVISEATHKLKQKAFSIWIVGDAQIGHPEVRWDLLFRHRDYAQSKAAYVILGGDLCETITLSSRIGASGEAYYQTPPHSLRSGPVDDQVSEVISLFAPFKGRILACVRGNHERRALVAGVDLTAQYAAALDAFHTYLGDGGFVQIDYPGHRLKVFVHHGEGPAVSPTTLFDRLERDFPGAHVYVAGHIHRLLVEPVVKVTPLGSETVWRARWGSYLPNPDYAVRRPITPQGGVGSLLLHVDEGRLSWEFLV